MFVCRDIYLSVLLLVCKFGHSSLGFVRFVLFFLLALVGASLVCIMVRCVATLVLG